MRHRAARRAASALAATTLLTLGGAATALARTDGTFAGPSPQPSVSLPYSQEIYEMHYLGRGRFVNEPTPAAAVPADPGSSGYLPAGAGVLAGLALAGAGAVVVSRRHHHTHAASA